MKAVLLAAGRGIRMGVLTDRIPKPLLKVCGKPLITYALDALPRCIDSCVVVIGYRGDDIRDFLGVAYFGVPLSYVAQEQPGTGGALYSARTYLAKTEYFFVVGTDDVFGAGELDTLVCGVATYGITYGVPVSDTMLGVLFDDDNRLIGRKTVTTGPLRYFGVGAYVLPPAVFGQPFYRLRNGEYSIPHSLESQPFPVYVRHIGTWLPVNTPGDIVYAEHALRARR